MTNYEKYTLNYKNNLKITNLPQHDLEEEIAPNC